MDQILLLALHNCLDEEVRQAIMKISRVYQRLCRRKIQKSDWEADISDAGEALCLLEKVFPPTFMHLMSNLMIHLVEELYI